MFNRKEEAQETNIPEKTKPPFYKRGWFIAVAGIIIGAGLVGGDDEDTVEESDTEEVSEVEAAEEEPEEEVVEEPEEEVIEEEPVEQEEIAEEEPEEEVVEEVAAEEIEATEEVSAELEEELKAAVSNDFVISFLQGTEMGDMGVFDYNESMDAATYLVTDSDAAEAFSYMAVGMFLEDYAVLRETYVGLSESMGEISDMGFILLNPNNTENILLWIQDGVILYDFVDDL